MNSSTQSLFNMQHIHKGWTKLQLFCYFRCSSNASFLPEFPLGISFAVDFSFFTKYLSCVCFTHLFSTFLVFSSQLLIHGFLLTARIGMDIGYSSSKMSPFFFFCCFYSNFEFIDGLLQLALIFLFWTAVRSLSGFSFHQLISHEYFFLSGMHYSGHRARRPATWCAV